MHSTLVFVSCFVFDWYCVMNLFYATALFCEILHHLELSFGLDSPVKEWDLSYPTLTPNVMDLRAMRTLERFFEESMINLFVMTLQWRYFCLLCWFRFMLMYVNKALYIKLCIWNTNSMTEGHKETSWTNEVTLDRRHGCFEASMHG